PDMQEQTFIDPHPAFNNMLLVKDTVRFLGQVLDAFYNDLASTPDPACTSTTLDKTTVLTVHGDTPHTPLQANAWPDQTPDGSNWLYVMGAGFTRTGWFGGVHADGSVDGFDPASGMTVPDKSSDTTSTAAGAAVAYAVAKGDKNVVAQYYNG